MHLIRKLIILIGLTILTPNTFASASNSGAPATMLPQAGLRLIIPTYAPLYVVRHNCDAAPVEQDAYFRQLAGTIYLTLYCGNEKLYVVKIDHDSYLGFQDRYVLVRADDVLVGAW